ncbi:acyltransferase family protein [Microbulbifer pacificus]|uniref:Acyltransferase n=1 Tax=Microbulbifer pacificus TaxID=407164 RepID=A0AAU0MYL1_9GAMM|nr:acyltransferase [Microbulbifer pacificus]WOX04851.1 acyltransferase [Microbulbifer pacificus]
MINSIQALRGIAAFGVVYSHANGVIRKRYSELGLTDPIWEIEQGWSKFGGGVGVDLFLLLSGFIIFYTGWNKQQDFTQFLTKRFSRIFPIWWVALLGVIAISLIPGSSSTFNLYEILTSFLLIPISQGGEYQKPILEVGWALHYIVAFYIIYAFFSKLDSLKALKLITLFLLSCTLAGLLYSIDAGIWTVLTNPRMLSYAVGGWMAYWYINGSIQWSKKLSFFTYSFIAIMSYMFIFQNDWRSGIPLTVNRVPIAAAILFLVLFNPRISKIPLPKFLVAFGGSSYSIYLFHMFPLMIISGIWKREIFLPSTPPLLTWFILILIGVLAGLAAYFIVEKPLQKIRAPLLFSKLGKFKLKIGDQSRRLGS